MKTDKWLTQFKQMLDREELSHLNVHKAIVKMQFENPTTKVIEIHSWEYESKDAKNLIFEKGGEQNGTVDKRNTREAS